MSKFVLKSTNTETVVGYIIALLLIITTRGIWIYDYAFNITHNQLCFLACVISIIGSFFLIFSNRNIGFSYFVQWKIAVAFVCCVLYLGLAGSNRLLYIQTFLGPFFCFVLYLFVSKNKECVWNCFTNLMVIIACISLIFYVGGTVLDVIPASRTATFEWAYTRQCRTFYNLYYEAQRLNTSSGFLQRNCGIFTEAPMYSFLLCTAIGIEVFLKQYPSRIKCIILVVTVLTTRSTTGYLFLLMSLFFSYINNAFLTKKLTVKKLLFVVIIIVGAFVVIQLMDQKVSFSSGSNSVQTRSDHLKACIQAWLHSPLWGVGYQNQDSVLKYANVDQGMSVGFLYMLACSGLILTFILLFPSFSNMLSLFKRRRLKPFFFELLILILYFFTAVTSTPIILYYIAYITSINTVHMSFPMYSNNNANNVKRFKKYKVRWRGGNKRKLVFTGKKR